MDGNIPSSVQRIVARAAFQALSQHAPPPLRFRYRGPDNEGFVFEQEEAPRAFGGVLPFLGRIIRVTLIVSSLLSISMASYLWFYHTVMPCIRATETLYFDYTGTPSHSLADVISMTWASVDLFRHNSWDAFEETVEPPPKIHARLLDMRRSYSLETILTLPDSSINQQAGIFGVVVELWSTNGTQLAISRRSVRFPHQSRWISNIRKTFCLIPLLIGAIDETRTVIVPSFRHYVESREFPVQHVVVKIVSRPGRPDPHASIVEISGGEIQIGEEMTDFQELLKRRFYVCMTVGTAFFACFYILLWYALKWLYFYIQRRFLEEEPPCDLDIDNDSYYDMDNANLSMNDEGAGEPANGTESANHSVQSVVHNSAQRAPPGFVDIFDSNEWEDLDLSNTPNHAETNGVAAAVVEDEEDEANHERRQENERSSNDGVSTSSATS